MSIHPTAIVEDGAELGADVIIGPMCHVARGARLRDGVVLKSHVAIEGSADVGARTVIHPFAVLGGSPQHLRYRGEETQLIIGEGVIIREYVTMNRGTAAGGGVTRIGDRCFFMSGTHVAHDCQVGDDVIFAVSAIAGGHVTVGDGASLGGASAVHQNCRIGAHAFIGGGAVVVCDVIPYASAFGNHARLAGLNIIGMKRRGMKRQTIHAMRNAYRLFFSDEDTFKERVERVRGEYGSHEEVARIIEFIDAGGSRPLMTPAR